MMAGTPPTTPRDTNGEGRWRLQALEREVGSLRSEFNSVSRDFIVHQALTADFIRRMTEHWSDERKENEDEKKADKEWKEEQEKRLDFVRKVSIAALVSFITLNLGALVNAVILISNR